MSYRAACPAGLSSAAADKPLGPQGRAVVSSTRRVFLADRLAEFVLAGNPARQVEWAADRIARLEQRYLVSALRGGDRGGQAGRSRADDGHPLGASRRSECQCRLVAGARIE